jgi:hypothetical protein
MAKQLSFTSNLGLYAYGVAAIVLGILGLVSGDFAISWQECRPNIPSIDLAKWVALGRPDVVIGRTLRMPLLNGPDYRLPRSPSPIEC